MKVGGQAIIEGVMMIGRKIAIAVRDKEGNIVTEILGVPKKGKIMKVPFLRGFYSLYLSLYFGIKALTRSAEISSGEKMKKSELSLIHISEPTRPRLISYAVSCLNKKINEKM